MISSWPSSTYIDAASSTATSSWATFSSMLRVESRSVTLVLQLSWSTTASESGRCAARPITSPRRSSRADTTRTRWISGPWALCSSQCLWGSLPLRQRTSRPRIGGSATTNTPFPTRSTSRSPREPSSRAFSARILGLDPASKRSWPRPGSRARGCRLRCRRLSSPTLDQRPEWPVAAVPRGWIPQSGASWTSPSIPLLHAGLCRTAARRSMSDAIVNLNVDRPCASCLKAKCFSEPPFGAARRPLAAGHLWHRRATKRTCRRRMAAPRLLDLSRLSAASRRSRSTQSRRQVARAG
mmetsp:Transcript_29603/g.64367  ORF Transcript_29603/g.64367 Transcript_29603/m.64367 type:complete len:296 (+) Transcript_29603:496-1383(+)